MTRICMLSSSYPRYVGDGAGSFIASLAIELVAQGHEVHVVAPWDTAIEKRDEQGVSVHRFRYAPRDNLHLVGHGRSLEADRSMKRMVPLLMPAYIWQAVTMVCHLHRKHHFDLIHGQWAVPGGPIASVASALCDCPLVVSMHGSDVYVMERSRLYRAGGRIAFGHARQVTACSKDLFSRAQAMGLHSGNVIPYGVNASKFNGQPQQGLALRSQLGINPDVPLIGTLGRLVHKKGFDILLEAMAIVLHKVPNAICVIGGDGDLAQDLQRQAERLNIRDHVVFPGHISWEQSPAFYAACDAFALPSVIDHKGNVDGLPNVLLEAMASACPIVATKIGGVPSVIRDRENGLLVEQRDTETLAQSLVELLSNKKQATSFGTKARAFATENLGWDHIASQYARVYLQATEQA